VRQCCAGSHRVSASIAGICMTPVAVLGRAGALVYFIRFSMSSSRQQVVLGPILIPFGYLPLRIPSHQLLGETGIIGSTGGSAFGSPRICLRRRSLG